MISRKRSNGARGGIVVATLLLSRAAMALADEPARDVFRVPSFSEQLYRQWWSEDLERGEEDPEWVRTRDEVPERLALREAVAVALENNPQIAVERLGPGYARTEIDRTLGVFDPTFSAYGRTSRSITPTGSALAGAAELRERRYEFGSSLSKLLRTGATLSATFDSEELQSNSQFLGLRPQYRPTVEFSITQPLLRNFGADLTILLVRSAEVGSNAAYQRWRAEVTALVQRVVQAYWDVVLAQENVRAETDGLAFAQNLERENEARVRAGALPPIAVKEAQAEAASREERVLVAENARIVASERLRLLLQRNPSRTFLPRPIEPADSPESRDLDLDESEVLSNAVAHRPEVEQARYEIENQGILSKVKRNNLLPGLDANASYGLNGLSGRPAPQIDFQSGETVVTRFAGDYGRALDRLKSNDFNSYSAGLTLSIPLGNQTASAEYTQSRIDLRRAELRYRQLLADVTLEVRQSIADVRSSSKRITASRLARELAQENLAQQHKRYDAGLATTKDILDFQEKVTTARAAEIRALIDYNVSLASLRRAEGRLLEQFDVVLDRLPPNPSPWWSKF